jgi:nucleoside-diphosphate-sugar epimerase
MPPNFYYNQWDYLTQASHGKRWSISSARPHAICGDGVGSPMNLPMVLAVYAVLSRELGLPLQFPGSAANYHALYQVTDATLLARAMVWMSTEPRCANQAFNITNGDLIRWENFWPKMARYWGMELAPRRPIRLAQAMADKGPLWDQMVARYGLRATSYPDLVSWGYGDFVFASDFDIISHTGKCRRYGFYEFEDTEAMFFRLWDQYRAAGVLPG